MLANKETITTLVKSYTDMKQIGWSRRTWCDKTKVSEEQRLLTFKFYDEKQADKVAKKLQAALTAQGYANVVRRTSVEDDWETRTDGGEYVRVRAMFK